MEKIKRDLQNVTLGNTCNLSVKITEPEHIVLETTVNTPGRPIDSFENCSYIEAFLQANVVWTNQLLGTPAGHTKRSTDKDWVA